LIYRWRISLKDEPGGILIDHAGTWLEVKAKTSITVATALIAIDAWVGRRAKSKKMVDDIPLFETILWSPFFIRRIDILILYYS
jgi:hypothetical protein